MYSKIKPTISQVYSKEKPTVKKSRSVRFQLPNILHSIILISKQTKEMYSNNGARNIINY